MTRKLILSSPLLEITISRLRQELIENQIKDVETVILGLQPRGIFFAERIAKELSKHLEKAPSVGKIDATFFRDDYRRRETVSPNSTDVPFLIENKRVILVDDVLATGRMVRAALDAGGVPDNFLHPEALRRLDRELLRDALRVVKTFQQHVRGVFHLTD